MRDFDTDLQDETLEELAIEARLQRQAQKAATRALRFPPEDHFNTDEEEA